VRNFRIISRRNILAWRPIDRLDATKRAVDLLVKRGVIEMQPLKKRLSAQAHK